MNGTHGQGRGIGIRLLPLLLAGLVAAFVAMRGCQEGPFGRRQIVGLNEQQEHQLGLEAFREVLNQSDVLQGGPTVDAVQQITRRLVGAVRAPAFLRATMLKRPPEFEWAVRVVRSKEVNAFCLPGGKMVVYTGILPVAETHAGLATVMGHEIAHALAHHGAERMAQGQIAQILLGGAAGSMGDMDPAHRQQVLQILNAGAKFGILKYSRDHESEADHMGVYLMAAAGYDPRETVRFWERMAAATQSAGRPPEFLSTHPSHETRIRDLTEWIPKALPLYEANRAPAEDQRLPRDVR
jgi:predicted Zn-dependent protease